jgi:hypothetical protein
LIAMMIALSTSARLPRHCDAVSEGLVTVNSYKRKG